MTGTKKTKANFKTQLQKEFKDMCDSVVKYKGFYIGRYETSLSEGKSSSKREGNSEIFAENNWYYQYKYNKDYAEGKSSVVSSTIWGCQYDAMMAWMKGNGIDVRSKSPVAGAERNQTRITGSTGSKDKLCNIYDLLGNSYEWTMEANRGINRVARSDGPYTTTNYALQQRTGPSPTNGGGDNSSRLTLYIK